MQRISQFKKRLLNILNDFLSANPFNNLSAQLNEFNNINELDLNDNNKHVLAKHRQKSYVDLGKFKNTRYKDYMASADGKIYSIKSGLILSPRIDKDGYEEVSIMIDARQTSKTVHRIIAETWIPNPKKLPYVNHINGNRSDNRISNLEWTSVSENNMNKNKNNGPQYDPKYEWQYQPKRIRMKRK